MIRPVRAGRPGTRLPVVPAASLMAFMAAVLAPLGCGGGGGGGSPTPTPTPPTSGTLRLHVPWPDRTKAVPLGANSLSINVVSGANTVFSRLLARTAQDTAYADDISVPNLPFGAYTVNVTAFTDAAGTGTVLGTASVPVTLSVSAATPTVGLDTAINSAVALVRLTGGTTGNPLYTAFPMTALLLDSSSNVLPAAPHQITWSSSDPANVAVDANGNVTANVVEKATIMATDKDSGRSASLLLQLGCPLSVNVALTGTDSELPIYTDQADDSQTTTRTVSNANSAGFAWVGDSAANRYTIVTLRGNPVTLAVPDTYGAFAFTGWTLNGAPFASTPALTIDPKQYSALNLAATYTSRAPTADGYTPNYLKENDIAFDPARPNQLVRWALGTTRVTFIAADNYTAERKALCIEGFQWWKRAIKVMPQFTLLPDNDVVDADIIVCLTSDPFSVSCRPDLFQAGLVPVARGTTSGRTFFMTDPNQNANAAIIDGVGKRVIHIYVTDTAALHAVAGHEFAHAIGMNGHSENNGDLMYPIGVQSFPSGRDVNTVRTILDHSRAARTPGSRAAAVKGRAVAVP